MKDRQLLLGFDARVRNIEGWDTARRDRFLIRMDVTRPYSTDAVVWPAVMDSDSRPAECLGHQTLWNDEGCLKSSLISVHVEEYTTIAITVDLHGITKADSDAWEDVAIENDSKNRAWQFLGYDVSDRWLLSALSNCGFLPGENADSFRGEWAHYLNDRHLFDDVDAARSFKDASNTRAVEHSPFFVFGMWSTDS